MRTPGRPVLAGVLLMCLVLGLTAAPSARMHRRGRGGRRAAALTRPPPADDVAHARLPPLNAHPRAQPAGSINILSRVDASTASTVDVSATIDAIAAEQNSTGRTLFFPGPQEYFLSPASRGRGNWTTPAALTLHLGGGACFKAAQLAQIFMGGPLVAAPEQIFTVSAGAVTLKPNVTAGGRLTSIIATTPTPHHFTSGMRFRLTGADDKEYMGNWGATLVLSPTTFCFEVAHPPATNSTVNGMISIASFFWNKGSAADTDARPGGLYVTGASTWVYPEYWGAVGTGQLGRNDQPPTISTGHDSTSAVQFAFDSGAAVLFLQDYAVSRVTLCGGNRLLDGHNHFLIGNQFAAGSTTNAVFEIKCGSSIIRDVWIMGAFDKGYEAGAHWYTNDLNLWQPEFNRIEGMQFWWLVIGLAVGALPSQPSCCAWQGVVVADAQATNCPLSESSLTGLDFYGTVEAIHYHQPNGYLQITDSTIGAQPLGWVAAEGHVYPGNDSVALHIPYGSLDVVNCDLENVAVEAWKFPGARTVRILGGSLNLHNVIYEAMNSFHIGTRPGSGSESSSVNVVWNGGLDDGLNGAVSTAWRMNFFDIHPEAKGSLVVKDQDFSRGAGYANEEPASFIWRDVTNDTSAAPVGFDVVLDGVTLRDWSWIGDERGYYPIARGVPVELRNVKMTSWSAATPPGTPSNPAGSAPSLQYERHFHGVGHSLLTRAVDVSGATVGPLCTAETSPFTSCSLFSGGWSANGSTGTTVNATNASLPKITAGSDRSSPAPTHAIQVITMPTTESWAMVTAGCDEHGAAVIEVEPGRHYVLQGFIRTNCGGGDGGYGGAKVGSVSVRASFGRFDSTPSGTAGADNTTLLELPAKLVGCPGWEPLMLAVAVPGDAMRLVLHFGATGGAALSVYALSLR